jgi:hypothetical protein
MRNKAGLLFIVALLFLAACELTPEQPFTPKLVVHCLLRAGENPARVRVNRSYRLGEKYDSIFPLARVSISSGRGEWRLTYAGADSYISTGPVPVQTGDSWLLLATHPELDTVRARTIIPQPYEILFPRPGDTVSVRDSMVWTRSQTAKGYYLSLRRVRDLDTSYLDALIPNDSFDITYDPLLVRIPAMFFLLLVAPLPDSPPRPCTLWVWALDTNYYDWVLGASGFRGKDSSQILRGFGVFGSAVERWVPVFVRGDTTTIQNRNGRR